MFKGDLGHQAIFPTVFASIPLSDPATTLIHQLSAVSTGAQKLSDTLCYFIAFPAAEYRAKNIDFRVCRNIKQMRCFQDVLWNVKAHIIQTVGMFEIF